jgi:hypothetical protein
MPKTPKHPNYGGARPGAGAKKKPAIPKKRWAIDLTESQYKRFMAEKRVLFKQWKSEDPDRRHATQGDMIFDLVIRAGINSRII